MDYRGRSRDNRGGGRGGRGRGRFEEDDRALKSSRRGGGNDRICIIIPFRDQYVEQKRSEQLADFVKFFKTFLRGYNARIYVVEQSDDGKLFNRGMLLNVGFDIAKNENTSGAHTIYIFHDVDLLPSDEVREHYTHVPYSGEVVHIAALWNRYGGKEYFGGITAFCEQDYEKINGYPNNYWGWGGEDDELRRRAQAVGLRIRKPNRGKITDLESMDFHQKNNYLKEKELKNNLKWELKALHESTGKMKV
jgi:hypothetical protein